MRNVLDPDRVREILDSVRPAQRALARAYPGPAAERQPVHTFYGGAHLFEAGVADKLGGAALAALREYAPEPLAFARVALAPNLEGAAGLPQDARAAARLRRALQRDPAAARRERPGGWLAHTVYERVVEKLGREPVEDYRIDFEDGYGHRPDQEEDAHARAAAEQTALGMERGSLPPFLGIRIKSLTPGLAGRAVRTLELFLATLLGRSGGRLPANFVVTLPKVTGAEQVSAMADLLEESERAFGLGPGTLRLEFMVETPQSLFDPQGRVSVAALAAAARGRCRGAHLGVYDYTASLEIAASAQAPWHPACAFARRVMQAALAGTGVTLSDGATTVMPAGPHRAPRGKALTPAQKRENREAVHRAWRLHAADVTAALGDGYYQGWDLHPGQLPTRYAAVFAFYLRDLEQATARLAAFMERSAQATRVGTVFDDAATGQGLLNYFLRGLSCGALTREETLAAGLTLEELGSRSFLRILEGRRAGPPA